MNKLYYLVSTKFSFTPHLSNSPEFDNKYIFSFGFAVQSWRKHKEADIDDVTTWVDIEFHFSDCYLWIYDRGWWLWSFRKKTK